MKFILSVLVLLFVLHAAEQQESDNECAVKPTTIKCRKCSECQTDFKCILTVNSKIGSCHPVCAGKRGLQCNSGSCCFIQANGTYTTSPPPFIVDEQGVCL